MIIGVGIDVVDVARFTQTLERTPRLAERLFTKAEQQLPPASLAARFAVDDITEWHEVIHADEAFEIASGLIEEGTISGMRFEIRGIVGGEPRIVVEHVTRPMLTLFHARGNPNGITLLIVPGGAYVRVVIDKEGFESAEWFAARGFECAVLRYRLPADGWEAGADAPLHEIGRASCRERVL